jgi:hypothetical protein
MYTSVDFTSQIVGRRGPHTPIVVTLKIDYYYNLYMTLEKCRNVTCKICFIELISTE